MSWLVSCHGIQPGQQKQKPWKQRPRPSGAPVRRRAASRAWIPGLYLALHALPGYIWLPKAYGNMMKHVLHDVPHDVDNPLWYLSMKIVRIRWKCIRHIFGLRTPGRSNRNLKSLEVS